MTTLRNSHRLHFIASAVVAGFLLSLCVHPSEGSSSQLLPLALVGAGCKNDATEIPDGEAKRNATADWECLFRSLYNRSAGFESVEQGKPGASLTYGEFLPSGVSAGLAKFELYAPLDHDDVFYDLGSGTGKVLVQVFLTTPLRAVIGVELARNRHRHAGAAFSLLHDWMRGSVEGVHLQSTPKETKLEIVDASRSSQRQLLAIEGDLFEHDFENASVLMSSSLAFSEEMVVALTHRLSLLQPGTLVGLGSKCGGCHRGLIFLDKVTAESSWFSRSSIWIYMVAPALDFVNKGHATYSATSSTDRDKSRKSMRLVRLQALLQSVPPNKSSEVTSHRQNGGFSSLGPCLAEELEYQATRSIDRASEAAAAMDQELKSCEDVDSVLLHVATKYEGAKRAMKLVRDDSLGMHSHGFRKFQEEKIKMLHDLLALLLRLQADPNARDDSGKLALDIALERDDTDLQRLLRQHGATSESQQQSKSTTTSEQKEMRVDL